MIYHGHDRSLPRELETAYPPKSEMTRLPYAVTGTSFKLEYAFKPGCHWINVVAVKHGVEGTFDRWACQGRRPGESNDDSHMYEQILTYMQRRDETQRPFGCGV